MSLAELIARIEALGVTGIDLHATPEGMSLYEAFGFALRSYPSLQRLAYGD